MQNAYQYPLMIKTLRKTWNRNRTETLSNLKAFTKSLQMTLY